MVEIQYRSGPRILLIETDDDRSYGQSIEEDGFILDLDTAGEFMGLEVLDAPARLEVSPDMLRSIRNGDLDIDTEGRRMTVTIDLETPDKEMSLTSSHEIPSST